MTSTTVASAVAPEFPANRYAVELMANVGSPALSSRLVLILENLDHLITYYDSKSDTPPQLLFLLDTLSSVLTLSASVLRYKSVDRRRVVFNIVSILKYIDAEYYDFPEFLASVPRGTSKKTVKKG